MLILVFFLYFLCGLSFTLSKTILFYGAPIFFVAVRMIIAGTGLLAYYFYKFNFKNLNIKILNIKDIFLFLLAIIFHIYLTYLCDAWALNQMTSIESAFIYNFSPFIAALFSYLVFSERMNLQKWLGMIISFAALVWMLVQNTELICCQNILATIIMFLAVISSSYGWIIVRQLIQKNYNILFINGLSMLFGGILALITSIFVESCHIICPVSSWPEFLLGLASIILVMNIGFYNLYGYLLKYYTATFIAFAGFTCPFFAQLFGYIFLQENISYNLVISTIIITFGLYIFYRSELKQGYINI